MTNSVLSLCSHGLVPRSETERMNETCKRGAIDIVTCMHCAGKKLCAMITPHASLTLRCIRSESRDPEVQGSCLLLPAQRSQDLIQTLVQKIVGGRLLGMLPGETR